MRAFLFPVLFMLATVIVGRAGAQRGKEVGVYQDPGRTLQQMIDCFDEHTAMDDQNIETKVDRYIARPGQALLTRYRRKASSFRGGDRRRRFCGLELADGRKRNWLPNSTFRPYDAILDQGPFPPDVLEMKITEWIQERE